MECAASVCVRNSKNEFDQTKIDEARGAGDTGSEVRSSK
jgi:hypothetical protein